MTGCVIRQKTALFLATLAGAILAPSFFVAAPAAALTPEQIIAQVGLQNKTLLVNSQSFISQQIVNNGVSVRLYQSAFDKAVAEIPDLLGNTFSETNLSYVFKTGSADLGVCTLSYE